MEFLGINVMNKLGWMVKDPCIEVSKDHGISYETYYVAGLNCTSFFIFNNVFPGKTGHAVKKASSSTGLKIKETKN